MDVHAELSNDEYEVPDVACNCDKSYVLSRVEVRLLLGLTMVQIEFCSRMGSVV